MDPILAYIKDERLPSDPSEARKIRVRLSRFTILNDELYKRGFSLSFLKCLDSGDAMYVLRKIHEGICGNHLSSRSLVGKVVQAGYFWPTMQKDAVEIIQKCDKCQQFENVQHVPLEHQANISSPWPSQH